ncbi:hypothetical protein ACJJTC_012523 [Scirpophaga incertulas]
MLAVYTYTSCAHKLPRCFCPIEYDPVCGTNDKNYISECVLRCAARQGVDVKLKARGHCNDHTLSIAHDGSCHHTVIVAHQPDCVCSSDFKPVCGADGVTYPNECALKCAGQNLVSRGPCEPPCKCPKDGKQICASDGNTYGNTCLLHCAIKIDSDLHALYGGACKHNNSCSCNNFESFPVCGSDMKTYDNECVMTCAGAKLLKAGSCEPPCECPAGGTQVCGSDGVTYANDCELNCATKDNSRLMVAKTVCGDNLVTYNNLCLLRCAGQKMLKEGPCEPPCACPRGGKRVCGSDGKSYGNVCLLNCATQHDFTLRVAHPGNC